MKQLACSKAFCRTIRSYADRTDQPAYLFSFKCAQLSCIHSVHISILAEQLRGFDAILFWQGPGAELQQLLNGCSAIACPDVIQHPDKLWIALPEHLHSPNVHLHSPHGHLHSPHVPLQVMHHQQDWILIYAVRAAMACSARNTPGNPSVATLGFDQFQHWALVNLNSK